MMNKNAEGAQNITKIRLPILLIPGICGSQLLSKNKLNGEQKQAWINSDKLPSSIAGEAAQSLWGYTDTDLTFKSFLNDYIDILPVEGIKGCAKTFNFDILDSNYLENLKLGKYFSTIIKKLKTDHSYCEDENLFGFSYDWRQSPCSDLI